MRDDAREVCARARRRVGGGVVLRHARASVRYGLRGPGLVRWGSEGCVGFGCCVVPKVGHGSYAFAARSKPHIGGENRGRGRAGGARRRSSCVVGASARRSMSEATRRDGARGPWLAFALRWISWAAVGVALVLVAGFVELSEELSTAKNSRPASSAPPPPYSGLLRGFEHRSSTASPWISQLWAHQFSLRYSLSPSAPFSSSKAIAVEQRSSWSPLSPRRS